MKIQFPLYLKILGWFFLNLVVLGVMGALLARTQFRFGLDSLLAGRAGDRLEAVAELIIGHLREHPRAEWGAVLDRFTAAYGLEFSLVRNDGTAVAGVNRALPAEVVRKVAERRGGAFRAPGSPGLGERAGGPGLREGRGREGGLDRGGAWEENRGGEGAPGRGRARRAGPLPKFMVHTKEPPLYWVGVRLPPVEPSARPAGGLTLLIVSSTLRGGGLLFDSLPWIIFGAGGILCSALFWVPLVRGITRSISQMSEATERMAEGDFEARVRSSRRDELGHLAAAINRMGGRLAGFVSGQKRFLGDIAHELCAPIARIQMALGILEERADEGQKGRLEDLREEIQEMSSLVNELLSFSKAGLRQREARMEPVALREVAEKAAAREGLEGEAVRIEIPKGLTARGDPELLGRALANLLRNAIRYAGAAGPVTMRGEARGGRAVLTVADEGPGAPENLLERIFDPFFRVEESRSRETGGIGLGLAIVKTCVEACGGTVRARNRTPRGLEVEMAFEVCP